MEKSYRYKTFGLVIHPLGSQEIDFASKNAVEMTAILRDLSFFTPVEMAERLSCLKVLGNKKKSTSDRYFSTVELLRGQLELGSETKRPHYQIFVELSIKITKKQLLKSLSLALFHQENSPCISVMVSTSESSSLISYCQKSMRANLLDEYSDVVLSNEMFAFYSFLRSNPEAKFFLPDHFCIKNGSWRL
jgi:hypothetical protein